MAFQGFQNIFSQKLCNFLFAHKIVGSIAVKGEVGDVFLVGASDQGSDARVRALRFSRSDFPHSGRDSHDQTVFIGLIPSIFLQDFSENRQEAPVLALQVRWNVGSGGCVEQVNIFVNLYIRAGCLLARGIPF